VVNFPPMGRYAETLSTSHASPANTRWLDVIKWRRFGAALTIALALTLAGWTYSYLNEKDNAVIGSLAVLPFLNVDADQGLEYLSDGMTETLISDLSELPNVNVKARSSVFRYKDMNISVRGVGADLNVQAILNGRISRHDGVLMLSLELADVRTENVIWSKQYSCKPTELVSLQSQIAFDVSEKLRLKIAGAGHRKQASEYSPSAEAYASYLKGRYYWNKRTVNDLHKAIECFNQAVATDRNYALAYAGLADTYVVLSLYRNDPALEERLRAREAAMKALSLNGDLAEAHTALGFVNTQDYDFASAEREYKRAVELNPNYATAHQWYGEMLSHLGRHDEATAQLRLALSIDPLSLIINVMYGNILFHARRYDEAIAQMKKTLELDNNFAITHQCLARIYQANGNYADAVAEFARYQELNDEQKTATQVRESFKKGGWPGFLRAMTGEHRPANLSDYERVIFLAALGEKDKAFAEPYKSYETIGLVLKVDPLFDPLRNDQRFSEVLTHVKFAPE